MSETEGTGSPGVTRRQAKAESRNEVQPAYPERPNGEPAPKPWVPPKDKQEYVVTEKMADVPEWIDKGWVGFGALKVPVGDYPFDSPYTTEKAEPGDTIQFSPAGATRGGHFTVVKNTDPDQAKSTPRPAQESAATLEDLLKSGHLAPDEMRASDKQQVRVRSPKFQSILDGEAEIEKTELTVRAASA